MFRRTHWALMPLALAGAVVVLVLSPAPGRADLRDRKADGHAGMFQEETIEKANDLIKRMKEDTGYDFIIETFDKPLWTPMPGEVPGLDDRLYPKDPRKKPETLEVALDKASSFNRRDYFTKWAERRARELNVHGVYLLLTKSPGTGYAVSTVGPDVDPRLFPEGRRAWLEKKLKPVFWQGKSWNKHYDDDLLSWAIPAVWQTVHENQAALAAGSEIGTSHWTWLGTLKVIGVFLAVWVGIAMLRGLVALFHRGRPAAADLSQTRLGQQTTLTSPPAPATSTSGEDSVDY